jgi:hypothetical protein
MATADSEEVFDDVLPPTPEAKFMFPDDEHDKRLNPPRNFVGFTEFEIKSGGRKPTIVRMYGERHPDDGPAIKKKLAMDTVNFLNRALNDPALGGNRRLLIEGRPGAHLEQKYSSSVINDVGYRLGSLRKGLVETLDRRKEESSPALRSEKPNIVQIRRAQYDINKEIKPYYEAYPKLKDIFKSHTTPEIARKEFFGAFNSPLFDAQLIGEIEKAHKEGYNLLTYTGDAHRTNLEHVLDGVKGITITNSHNKNIKETRV